MVRMKGFAPLAARPAPPLIMASFAVFLFRYRCSFGQSVLLPQIGSSRAKYCCFCTRSSQTPTDAFAHLAPNKALITSYFTGSSSLKPLHIIVTIPKKRTNFDTIFIWVHFEVKWVQNFCPMGSLSRAMGSNELKSGFNFNFPIHLIQV